MKELKRNQISELRKTVPMLDSKELSSIIGGDMYYFDENGRLSDDVVKSEENVIYIGDKCMSLSGTLDGLESIPVDSSGILFSGAGVSSQLFEFLAENTNVEWAYGYNSRDTGTHHSDRHPLAKLRDYIWRMCDHKEQWERMEDRKALAEQYPKIKQYLEE